ncbi:hypothetical protein [Leifsonia sp. EB34]|uniref:hypothetical protein n=1 Tax=Leifsonia sp. EB34 TaxID=3156303 RepID=UPI003517B442
MDYTTDDDLRRELSTIHSTSGGWYTPAAATLLAHARRRFTGLARREGADPADAMTAAWEIWSNANILTVAQPWAYTGTAVRKALRKEQEAQRKLTSIPGLRRPDADDFTGWSDEELPDLVAQVAIAQERLVYRTLALNTVLALLVEHGYSRTIAEATVESMISAAAATGSPAGALDAVTRISDVPTSFGVRRAEWKALASLLFGPARGGVGSLEAELTGADNQKHLRNTLARYHRLAARR